MNSRKEIHVPPGGPPQAAQPSSEIFDVMGKDGIYGMLADFYQLLGQSKISEMFPKDPDKLLEASKKSAAFFVQICGGPQIYNLQYGPPRLRARHMPFEIKDTDKDVWLDCFFQVLETAPEKFKFPQKHVAGFANWLTAFASWMVNKK